MFVAIKIIAEKSDGWSSFLRGTGGKRVGETEARGPFSSCLLLATGKKSLS